MFVWSPLAGPSQYSARKVLSGLIRKLVCVQSGPQLFSKHCKFYFLSLAGGDDVQQLCEAGEEEFLEIMMLVDMASKPLHVRRLQKALQEWVQNPGKSGLT